LLRITAVVGMEGGEQDRFVGKRVLCLKVPYPARGEDNIPPRT
jgi:hypothetical protein